MSELAHRFNVTVTCTDAAGAIKSLGTWDSLSGGGAAGEVTKYRPGGMANERAFGGFPASFDDLTVSRYYDAASDATDVPFLLGRVNKGTVTVTKQPLTSEGVAGGSSLVYSGILAGVNPPDVDSTSADVAMLEITVTVQSAVKGA